MSRHLLIRILPVFLLAPLLASCSAKGASPAQANYKEVKAMVLDILKTEESQKLIVKAQQTDASKQIKIKSMTTEDSKQMQLAVKNVLVSPDYSQYFQKIMTDTRFAGEFAKTVNKENKQIHKNLLKDPEYIKSLMEVMKSPDYQKIVLDSMKGQAYRQQAMTILQEALQSPLFRVEMLDLMKKALEEEANPKKQKKQGSSGGSSGSSDEQGGGQESSS